MKCKYCGGNRAIKKGFRKNLTEYKNGSVKIVGNTLQGENHQGLGTKSLKSLWL